MTADLIDLPYEADSLQMIGRLGLPDAGEPRPGVLVFPPAPGPGRQMAESVRRLNEAGYVALAGDLYGGGRFYDDLDEAMPLLGALKTRPEGLLARAAGAMHALAAHPAVDSSRLAAIGYCLGGTMSLELARSGAPLSAVVGFHTGLRTDTPENDRNIRAKVLICTGSKDREASQEDRAEFEDRMTAAGVDWRMSVYGGIYHSFTNPDADSYGKPDYARYDAAAHRRSWAEMLGLFEEVFPT